MGLRQILQLFLPFIHIGLRLKLAGLLVIRAVLLQEFDDRVVALGNDLLHFVPVGTGGAAHVVQHLLPADAHILTGGVGGLLVILMVLDQPCHDLLVRQGQQLLHLLHELAGVGEQFLIVALHILYVVVDALDLRLNGLFLSLDLLLRQIPGDFLPELRDLFPKLQLFLLSGGIGRYTCQLGFQLRQLFRPILFLV